MSKPGLLNTGPMMDLINDGVAKHFTVYGLHQAGDHEALFAEAGRDIRALCTGSHTGVRTDAAMLDRLPNLKIIGNFGVGYDTIDIAEAARRGIIITNTPEVLSEEVADTTIGLLLGTIREFYEAEKWLREGHWPRQGDYRLTAASLRDRSIGIIGMGRIGRAIGRRLEAFGRPISYYARNPQPAVAFRYYSDLLAMARDVDTLIAILPGGPATNNLINMPVLEALGPRGIFINVARGSVVDEAALIEALKRRKFSAPASMSLWESPTSIRHSSAWTMSLWSPTSARPRCTRAAKWASSWSTIYWPLSPASRRLHRYRRRPSRAGEGS